MSASASIVRTTAQGRAVSRRQASRLARTLFHVHERIMSRPTLRLAEDLNVSQWWPRERHAAHQLEHLRELLQHAVAHCPFYAGRRSQFVTAHNTELPLLSRSTLRRSHNEMRSRHESLPLIGHTHGTADEPVRFFWDRSRQAWDKAHRLRGHAWHGFEIGDRELHLWPVDPPASMNAALKHALRRARDRVTGDLQIDILNPRSAAPDSLERQWNAFTPDRVTAYPSVLAEVLGPGHLNLTKPGTVFLTGELTFPWQRTLIQRALGAPIVQNYGLQEVGPIAFECENGNWHTCAESVIVEFIRHGRAAKVDELAEIVVTGLQSHIMPMIRYCTGDIVRVSPPRDCPCGRGLPVISPILGRAGDFLIGENGQWIAPQELFERLKSWIKPGIFQVSQQSADKISIGVLESIQPGEGSCEGIRAAIRDLLGPTAQVDISRISTLARTRFGKCRYVRSALTTCGLAQLCASEDDRAEI